MDRQGRHSRLDARSVGASVPIAVAITAALLLLLGGSTARAAAAPKPVLSPSSGAKLPAAPVSIRIRAVDLPGALTAKLNGHDITKELAYGAKNVRSTTASPAHGLRHGTNVLVVRSRTRDGRTRSQTVRFTVSGNRPLASAGRDARSVVREQATLDASASRHAPAGRGIALTGSNGKLRYRWTITRAPKGSKLKVGTSRGIANPTAAKTSFTPDVLGTYQFKLTVTPQTGATGSARASAAASGSATDGVSVHAINPYPLVPFDSMAKDSSGKWGVKVGNAFYAAPDQTTMGSIQVLVLKRATLELVSNRSYACAVGDATCAQKAATDLAAYNKQPSPYLAVISAQPNAQALTNYITAFQAIGALYPPVTSLRGGQVSAVGVPGLPVGNATQNFSAIAPDASNARPGRLRGYLTPDQYANYRFVSGDPLTFDTRAEGSGPTTNVIKVGGTNYDASLPAGATGGFQVVVLDRMTAIANQNTFYATNSPQANAETVAMANALKALKSNEVALVASIGDPGGWLTPSAAPGYSSLASAIEAVGGLAEVAYEQGTADSRLGYSFIGLKGAQAGSTPQASPVIDAVQTDSRVNGMLTRDKTYLYTPRISDPVAKATYALQEVVYQPRTPWPYEDRPGVQAAIAAIGKKVGLGANPRTAYWIQPPNTAAWSSVQSTIRGLDPFPPPSGGATFTEDDFTTARDQLVTEIGWLINTQTYLANLAAPFGQAGGLTTWANLQQTAQEVADDVPAKQSEVNAGQVLDIVGLMLNGIQWFAVDVPGYPAMMAAVSIGYSLASETSSAAQDGSTRESTIRTTATQLGVEVGNQLSQSQTSFAQLGSIIASDYGRLKTVGTYGGCPPQADTSECPPAWQWTSASANQAGPALEFTLRRYFYERLMPVGFAAWRLPVRTTRGNVNGLNCKVWTGVSSGVDTYATTTPWNNFNTEATTSYRILPATITNLFEPWALTSSDWKAPTSTWSLPDTKAPAPADDLMEKLFGRPTGVTGENLGFYAPQFFKKNFQAKAFPADWGIDGLECDWES
jgi:hypothetical protein